MRIPILLYHDFRPDNFDITKIEAKKRPYIMRDSAFDAQLKWLHENGYRTVGLDRSTWTERSVALVFDDGYKSNYQFAYPLLKHYSFMATFFVTVCDAGQPDMMTWDELREMADKGMVIGSHSITHPYLPELPDRGIRFQLEGSKKKLEAELKRAVDYFSSPTGFYNKRVEKMAIEVGYKAACFSRVRLSSQDSDPFALGKIGVKRSWDIETFKAVVQGKNSAIVPMRLKQVGRDVAKAMLGRKRYERVREAMLEKRG